jgi:hypothetical protein
MEYQFSILPFFPETYFARDIADFLLYKKIIIPTKGRTFFLSSPRGIELAVNLAGLSAVNLPSCVINSVNGPRATLLDVTANIQVRLDKRYGLRQGKVAEPGRKIIYPTLVYKRPTRNSKAVVFLYDFSDENIWTGSRAPVKKEFAFGDKSS